jgi:hypothetical protein
MGMAIAVQGVRGVVASDCVLPDAPWQMNVSRTKRSIGSRSDFWSSALLGHRRVNFAAGRRSSMQEAARLARTRLLTASLVTAAVAAAILAAMPAAHAQDAPTTGQSSSAPASSPAPSSSAPASSSTSSSTQPATGDTTAGQTAPASQQAAGSKSDPVCFKLTGHCVDSSKTSGTKAGTAAAKAGSTGKKPLNLTAPDVRTVVPEEELKEPLPNTEQITETQEADTVSVKGEQGVPPDVPGGLGAIWWAVSHPSQAWRILTPAE